MTNTTAIDIDKLAEQVAKADPSISVGKINVQGNVEGSIVVGNRNVIKNYHLKYEINTDHGAVVNLINTRLEITKRAVDPEYPPVRRPRAFVGRKEELETLDEYIHNKWSVLLYGQSGMGKTTLVQEFAYSDAAKELPDGVVYLEQPYEGDIPSLQDTLQRVFDKLFVTNPPVKLTDSIIEANLAETRPLLVFDEVGLPQDALNRLPALFPHGAILVTSQDAPYDDAFEGIQIAALSHEEAVQLFIEKSRIKANEYERSVISQICEILEDVPMAIVTVANAIRQKRFPWSGSMLHTLESMALGLQHIRPPSKDKIQAAIERSFLLFYANTHSQAPREIELLLDVVAAPGKSVDRKSLENEWNGAEEAVKSLEDLEVLYANSPRLRLSEGLRNVFQSLTKYLPPLNPSKEKDFLNPSKLDTELDEARKVVLRRMLDELKRKHQPDFDFQSDELGNILGVLQWAFDRHLWDDVITLGQAIDPYLTLHGLWDAWSEVLNKVEVAGRNIKDSKQQALVLVWVLHQRGTREIGVGTRTRAISLLRRALMIRISQGDIRGATYTLHNLRILVPPNIWRRILRKIVKTIQKTRWAIPVALVGIAALIGVFLPPSLKMTKIANPTTYHVSGQVIEYSYIVDNAGLRPIPGPIIVTDDKGQAKCPDLETIGNEDGSLDWNETITCTGFYSINEHDIEVGSVTNTATARGAIDVDRSIISKPQSTTIYFDSHYLTLTIRTNPETYRNLGETITIAYIVRNAGMTILNGPITVIDDKTQVNCPDLLKINDFDNVLSENEILSCTSTYTITDADLKNGLVKFTARASAGAVNSDPQSITIFRIPQSGLTLSTLADHSTYTNIGEQITFKYFINNSGNTTLGPTQFTITDSLIGTTPINCGTAETTLAPDAMVTCTATYTTNEADLTVDSIISDATAAGGDSVPSQHATTTIKKNTSGNKAVLLNVQVLNAGDTFNTVGQQINYQYVVANTETTPLAGPVMINDDKNTVTCPDVATVGNQDNNLDPSENITCAASYTITQADLDAGSVTNTATASVDGIYSNAGSTTVSMTPTRSLILTATANPATYSQPNQVIAIAFSIKNTSTIRLGPVQFVVHDERVGAFNCGAQDSVLAPDESVSCKATYTITGADLLVDSINSSATASGAGATSIIPATVVLVRESSPALISLFKSADRETYYTVGEEVTYTYTVLNQDSVPMTGQAIVKDDMTEVVCPDIAPAEGQNFMIGPGQWLTCTAAYTITEADVKQGLVTNTAVAYVGQANSDPASVTIYYQTEPSSLSLKKSAKPDTYQNVGQGIRYTYFITNDGKYPLKGPLTVKDDKADVNCPTGNTLLYPGQLLICTAEYTITELDIQSGSVTNTAQASMDGVDSNPASVTINEMALTLEKSADHETYQHAGDVIIYTYKVTSQSRTPLPGPVIVSDDKLKVNCDDPQKTGNMDVFLDWHETVTCTGQYVISQADIDTVLASGGSYVSSVANTAIATVGRISSKPVTVTITAVVERALSLTMTADPTGFDSVNQSITYSYVVTNTGNVTVTSPIRITDDHVDNGTPFICESGQETLAPNRSVTCSAKYTIVQTDFEPKSVTNTAVASDKLATSSPATVTVTCPYPPNDWVRYIVESGETLSHIDSWFGNTTEAELQRKNCMGVSTTILQGQPLYIPAAPPPYPTITITLRDREGNPLRNTHISLINVNTGSSQTARTGTDGKYTFSNLIPGIYQIFQEESPFLRRGDHWDQTFVIVPVQP